MKTKEPPKKIKLPPPNASTGQLADFFDRHDGVDLEEQGIMVEDTGISPNMREILRKRREEPNTERLQIRVPASAKTRIESLARRKAVDVPTLVRIWVMDAIRREGMNRR